MRESLPDGAPLVSLAKHLEVISSEPRLRLLHALRRPTTLQEIRVPASVSRRGENPGRPLSRQNIAHHLDQLERAGLVFRQAAEGGPRGALYMLNHERLFALVDELRNLTRLRPMILGAKPRQATVAHSDDVPLQLPGAPRLSVAYGREEGVGFSLAGKVGKRWRIGRSTECEIPLDYDPYTSTDNTVLERTNHGFAIHDLPTSRNGTWLNWTRLPSGGSANLESGDVLIVGRTILVFKE